MIDLIYNILQTIINKENDGYISPEEFDDLAAQVQLQIFREYFEDENRDKNRENRGLVNKGYANLSFNQRQRINQFSAEATLTIAAGVYNLPTDLYFIEDDGITSDTGRVIEEVERSLIGYVANSISAPSTTYPVYERFSNNIRVLPSTLITDITCRYIREPANPRWC